MEKERVIYCKDTKEWRAWLEKNHLKEQKVALLKYKKHTGKPSLSHKESMDEAICFGWIDTTIKRLDDDRYIRRFARRTDASKWSVNTLTYGKRLLREGKMSPEGIRRYKEGVRKKPFDADRVENPSTPADLTSALKDRNLEKKFDAFAPSYKRMYLRWIEQAKQPATRKKRIDAVLQRVQENRKKWVE